MCNSDAIKTISMRLEKEKKVIFESDCGISDSLFEHGALSSARCSVEPANLWRETLVRNKRILEGSLRKGDWD